MPLRASLSLTLAALWATLGVVTCLPLLPPPMVTFNSTHPSHLASFFPPGPCAFPPPTAFILVRGDGAGLERSARALLATGVGEVRVVQVGAEGDTGLTSTHDAAWRVIAASPHPCALIVEVSEVKRLFAPSSTVAHVWKQRVPRGFEVVQWAHAGGPPASWYVVSAAGARRLHAVWHSLTTTTRDAPTTLPLHTFLKEHGYPSRVVPQSWVWVGGPYE